LYSGLRLKAGLKRTAGFGRKIDLTQSRRERREKAARSWRLVVLGAAAERGMGESCRSETQIQENKAALKTGGLVRSFPTQRLFFSALSAALREINS
jgi:hypothetical protein